MYKVTQTSKGYVLSVSYQNADSAQQAIEIAQMHHGYKGQWRAEEA
jgi:hypothetical protein